MRGPTALALLLTGLALSAPARAQPWGERILTFHADVTVNDDASLDVVETIRVAAGGQQIDHGIYRDFPTRRRGLVNHLFPFDVRAVTRDGAAEPFSVSRGGDSARVTIGAADVHLPIGLHTYVLTYRTARQLRAFADHDQLYWNVTGTEWALPIDEASADVHLPPAAAAAVREVAGYTGPAGAKAADLTATRSAGGATFRTTRPLATHEGLTILVTWPKGLVRTPTPEQARAALLRDNVFLGVGGVLVAALSLYVFSVGRQRRRAEQQARAAQRAVTEPPEGLSAAALHSVRRLGTDDTTFAAGILGLADKGAVQIAREDGTYVLRSASAARDALAPEERALAETLFRNGETLALAQPNARTISAARAALASALRTAHGDKYFVRRGGQAKRGLALALAAVVALAASPPGEARLGCAFLTVWLSGWSAGVYALVKAAAGGWSRARQRRYAPGALVGALFASLFALVFGGAEIAVLVAYGAMGSPVAAVLLAATLALSARLIGWLAEPTAAGVRVRAAADAYREHLATARPSRWSAATPPPFAYALALGITPTWSDLTEAGALTPRTAFRPFWWSRDDWNDSSFADLSTSLPSAVASATSSSSSGSSGSGSSGGGGGGGGGGGW